MDPSVSSTQTEESSRGLVRGLAERAILIPIGVAAVVRDELIGQLVSVSSAERADRQLRHLEGRGRSERDRIERELRRQRARVNDELGAQIGRVRSQMRNSVHDLAFKGRVIASKIEARVPTNT